MHANSATKSKKDVFVQDRVWHASGAPKRRSSANHGKTDERQTEGKGGGARGEPRVEGIEKMCLMNE